LCRARLLVEYVQQSSRTHLYPVEQALGGSIPKSH